MLGDPAGERYQRRCLVALAVLVGAMMVPVKAIHILAPGLAFGYIAWCLKRYLSEADELARRMHLEAMAYTYLAGMAVCMALGGLGKPIHPALVIVLDVVRAGFLYVIARRYS